MPNLCGERVAIPDTRQPGRHRRCREGNRCPKPGAGGPHILIVRQSPPKRDALLGRREAPRASQGGLDASSGKRPAQTWKPSIKCF